MTLSPEFRRNLWIEMSPKWLAIKGGLILLVLFIAWMSGGSRFTGDNSDYVYVKSLMNLGNTAMTIIVLLGALWGSRQAADAVPAEVANATWDAQRLSALSPSALGLGKLFGATASNWLMILLLLMVVWFVELSLPLAREATSWTSRMQSWEMRQPVLSLPWFQTILMIVIVQALAFILGLLNMRNQSRSRRSQSTISQVLALAFGWIMSMPVLGISAVDRYSTRSADQACTGWHMTFYGSCITPDTFVKLGLILLVIWLLVAVVRMMRVELQYRNGILVWLGFVACAVLYWGGVGYDKPSNNFQAAEQAGWFFHWTMIGMCVGALFLAAMLFDSHDVTEGRRLRLAFKSGDWRGISESMPLWVPMLPMLLIVYFGLTTSGASPDQVMQVTPYGFRRDLEGLTVGIIATGLFMMLLRDLAVHQLIGYAKIRAKGLAQALAIGFNYVLFPWLLFTLAGHERELYALALPFIAHSQLNQLPFAGITILLLVFAGMTWFRVTDPVKVDGDTN